MKRTLLLFSAFIGTFTFAQDCSELFISEYVEGWSNNKALEIYNPTGSPIDLSQYMVIRYSGSGGGVATSSNAIQLSGTVAGKDVYVAVLDKQDQNGTGLEAPVWDELALEADGWYCPVYLTNDAFYWNGDDAVVLAKGTPSNIAGAQLIDVFGKIGEDPGDAWTSQLPYNNGLGDEVTKDHSMIRKSTILKGITDPNPAYFNPLGEYDSIPAVIDDGMGGTVGNWSTLGEHTCDCLNASIDPITQEVVAIFPNPTTGEFYVNNIENYTTVNVVNALGQSVYTLNNNSDVTVQVNLNGKKGVYFVKLTNQNGDTLTKRVIIK